MTNDKNTLIQGAVASVKHKLMSVGGCTDTPLDLVTSGNADGNAHVSVTGRLC
jgi:hypothetical protein